MFGTVSSCGASNFSGFLASFFGSWSSVARLPRLTRRPAQLRWRTDRVEPGAGVGVVGFAAVAVNGDGLVEVLGDVAVGDEIRRLRGRHLDGGPQDDPGQAVAPDGGPEQLGVLAVGSEVRICAVGHEQVHRADVIAEAARAVMVLAVDVAGNRAADGDLAGARQHRNPQPERQRRLHQLVQADAGVDIDQPGVGADRVDAVQLGHVDHQAAAILRVVAVGTAQPACDNASTSRVSHSGDRLGDHLGIGGREHLRHRRRGAAKAHQPGGGGRNVGAQHRQRGYRLRGAAQRMRKITARCTMKLITVAVPCAMTNATGIAHPR